MKNSLLLILLVTLSFISNAQIKILFDCTKAETSGNADWVVDADLHDLDWHPNGMTGTGSFYIKSDPQRLPTPLQNTVTSSTPETYWEGSLSNWGIDCANAGYIVETLPYNVAITYGNGSNPQDLSNYKVFVMDEPNIQFTTAEKTAILQFVQNGGGLFMISDHNNSDRNGDTWDSPHIWNDFSSTVTPVNPFGITFDLISSTFTSSNVLNSPTDSILNGPFGTVTGLKFNGATTMTLDQTANSTVVGDIFMTGSSTSGTTNTMFAHCRYGCGKVAAISDSSPFDDGTGNPTSTLYSSYNWSNYQHKKLIMNATTWLATSNCLPTTLSITPQNPSVCSGHPITLTASLAGATSYSWSTGDHTAFTSVSPTTPTTYTVTVTGATTQVGTVTVTINAQPISAFSSSVATNSKTATFTNQSQNATTYSWSFGDASSPVGTTSPSHTYTTNGTYNVTLTATNTCGSVTSTHPVTINTVGIEDVQPETDFIVYKTNSNTLKVDIRSAKGANDFELYNITGASVLRTQLVEPHINYLDISELPSGIYIARMGGAVRRFVK